MSTRAVPLGRSRRARMTKLGTYAPRFAFAPELQWLGNDPLRTGTNTGPAWERRPRSRIGLAIRDRGLAAGGRAPPVERPTRLRARRAGGSARGGGVVHGYDRRGFRHLRDGVGSDQGVVDRLARYGASSRLTPRCAAAVAR